MGMTDDEIRQELDDAELSIEIDCQRDPDFIKVTSGKVYRPERTAHKMLESCGGYQMLLCSECNYEAFGTSNYCFHCGSRFV